MRLSARLRHLLDALPAVRRAAWMRGPEFHAELARTAAAMDALTTGAPMPTAATIREVYSDLPDPATAAGRLGLSEVAP